MWARLAHRLPFAEDLNYPFYNSTATTSNVNNRRPIQPGTLSQIYSVQSVMQASYNGLQITVEKRFSHHVSAKGFYTFSKDLEDVQLDNNTVNGVAQDYRALNLERGRSDNDRRKVAVGIGDLEHGLLQPHESVPARHHQRLAALRHRHACKAACRSP